MGEEQSEPSAGNSAPSAPAKRAKAASRKVKENAEGSVPSKPNLMWDSDALLTLLMELIHGNPDCWSILLKKQHGKGPVQARFAKHVPQYDHPLTLNKRSI